MKTILPLIANVFVYFAAIAVIVTLGVEITILIQNLLLYRKEKKQLDHFNKAGSTIFYNVTPETDDDFTQMKKLLDEWIIPVRGSQASAKFTHTKKN
jgi:hypothetical protein